MERRDGLTVYRHGRSKNSSRDQMEDIEEVDDREDGKEIRV